MRSWRAFTSSAEFVAVNQSGDTVTVTPMLPMAKPKGAFDGDSSNEKELRTPSAGHVGQAILRALAGLRPAST